MKPPDGQAAFLLHLKASRRRDEWATRGLACLGKGRLKAAREALAKAEHWHRIAQSQVPPPKEWPGR